MKSGEGPPTQGYTPAEEVALCSNEGRSLMGGVGEDVSSQPSGSGSFQQATFVRGVCQ